MKPTIDRVTITLEYTYDLTGKRWLKQIAHDCEGHIYGSRLRTEPDGLRIFDRSVSIYDEGDGRMPVTFKGRLDRLSYDRLAAVVQEAIDAVGEAK